jgi:hypothetical protein
MQSDSRLLHSRITEIELAQNRLADAADQNAQTFSDALKMSEAMSIVLQRVMNDMSSPAGIASMHRHAGGIDFNMYMREYWLCMLMADFATWCGKIATHDKPLIETVSAADVHEFGG